MKNSKFEEALKKMPVALAGSMDQEKTIGDLKFMCLHEIDMYEESQDGCFTAREIQGVRKYLKFLDTLVS